MDTAIRQKLERLLLDQTTAAIATLHQGAPFVSMVTFACAPDLSAIYLHISRLAYHTRDILEDARISLLIIEAGGEQSEPQSLARLSIMSSAHELPKEKPAYQRAKDIYLAKYPDSEMIFQLGDFGIFEIIPVKARLVVGFGQIYNLELADFLQPA